MTYFLIDSTNNNKVVSEFDSKEDAMSYVDQKEYTENWENSFDTFEDFKDEFFTVNSDETKAAINGYGSRVSNYWN